MISLNVSDFFGGRLAGAAGAARRFGAKRFFNPFGFPNDIGFVINDISPILPEPPETRLIFGKRDVFMITNVLEGSYILNNKMDFSTKIRHYWSGVKYNQFSELETNGYLSNTNYFSSHDANFNAWTI